MWHASGNALLPIVLGNISALGFPCASQETDLSAAISEPFL